MPTHSPENSNRDFAAYPTLLTSEESSGRNLQLWHKPAIPGLIKNRVWAAFALVWWIGAYVCYANGEIVPSQRPEWAPFIGSMLCAILLTLLALRDGAEIKRIIADDEGLAWTNSDQASARARPVYHRMRWESIDSLELWVDYHGQGCLQYDDHLDAVREMGPAEPNDRDLTIHSDRHHPLRLAGFDASQRSAILNCIIDKAGLVPDKRRVGLYVRDTLADRE